MGLAHFDLFAAEHEHVIELDLGADVALELFDANRVALGNPILFSACLNDRVHRES